MTYFNLNEFQSSDVFTRIQEVMKCLKNMPDSGLVIDPGTYYITTPRAREIQKDVMEGRYGENPQPVMFSPDFIYDRLFDFDGHRNTTVKAHGAKFITDGFMENISFRNCSGCSFHGGEFDTKRRFYSRGKVTELCGDVITVSLGKEYPAVKGMPHMRVTVIDPVSKRPGTGFGLGEMEYIDPYTVKFRIYGNYGSLVSKTIYIWHTFHSRPCVLMYNASDITVEDVTVRSHPGMGVTGQCSRDITLRRFKVIPAEGEYMSTNTDATHFAFCRGKVVLEDCVCEYQGDDGTNVHTYYYDITEARGCELKLSLTPPDGTHAQAECAPCVGDTVRIVPEASLHGRTEYRIVSVERNGELNKFIIRLDRAPELADGNYLLEDICAVPDLTVRNCIFRNHIARGVLVKCRNALIENCLFDGCSDNAIKIAAEPSWKEGIASDNVTVRDCTIMNCGWAPGFCSGILMYMEAEDRTHNTHGSVRLENNRISNEFAKYAVYIANVEKAVLTYNDLPEDDVYIDEKVEIIK